MFNIKQIIEAWVISYNPTPQQQELANLRGQICDVCPSKKVVTEKLEIATICGECGCPIAKKIFTNDYNPCPLKKWGEIDDKYFPNTKKKKTLF